MNIAKFEQTLSEQIAILRRQDGDLFSLDKLPDLLRTVLLALESPGEGPLLSLREQVSEMQQFIANARKEIAVIRPNAMREVDIPIATDELDAVVAATEEATNTILDSVEKLENICTELSPDNSEKLASLVVKIYEASNFQDITGQRIAKVVATLQGIEMRVAKLAALFPDLEENEAVEKHGDDRLLNGPQMPSLANAQDDIDALFD